MSLPLAAVDDETSSLDGSALDWLLPFGKLAIARMVHRLFNVDRGKFILPRVQPLGMAGQGMQFAQ